MSFKTLLATVFSAMLLSALAYAQTKRAPQSLVDTEYLNAQQVYLTTLRPADGWRTTASGLRYRVTKPGNGPRPSPTDIVTVHYTGTLMGGDKFDSSLDRGEPATFPLTKLIKGWQEGIPLMPVGSTYEFVIPYHLAYGPKGKGPIPGGALLRFTIQLIDIGG